MKNIFIILILLFYQNIFSQKIKDSLSTYKPLIEKTTLKLPNLNKEINSSKTIIPTSYGDKIITWDKDKIIDVNGIIIVNGVVFDERIPNQSRYRNAVMTIDSRTGDNTIMFSDHDGTFNIRPTKPYSKLLRVKEPKKSGIADFKCGLESLDSDLLKSTMNYSSVAINSAESRLNINSTACNNTGIDVGCSEMDANGKYVIDIFIGYSNDAVNYLINNGDTYQAHAARMVQTINQSLTNSLVDNVSMRLVGTSVKDHNTGINLNSDGLAYVSELFQDEIIETGADYIAMYQEYNNPKSYNTAEGWGDTQGRKSINAIESENVLRHEVGHNFGSSHCSGGSDGFPYANGFNNGVEKTIMCGNEILYYSNPQIILSGGAIGTESFNNNARLIKERASIIANIATHRIPYGSEDPCFGEGVVAVDYPQHFGTYLGNRINRVQIGQIDNSSADPICNNIVGYSEYRDLSTTHDMGSTVNYKITGNYNFPNSRTHIWIDWNADGVFKSSELIDQSTGLQILSGTFIVPSNISSGPKVMRIRRVSADNPYVPTPVTPGGNYEGGETEDYTFIVTDPNINNSSPTANDLNHSTSEDLPIQIILDGNDADGDTLTYSITQPNNGVAVLSENFVTYTPKANFNGVDNFTYRSNDGKSNSLVAKVTIQVSPVEDPPIASDLAINTKENTQIEITLSGIDPDGDVLTYSIGNAENGQIFLDDNIVTYTPNSNFIGSDSFTYQVSDGKSISEPAIVSITINSNRIPVVESFSVTTNLNTPIDVNLIGSDLDSDDLTFSIISVNQGSFVQNNAELTFSPNSNFSGIASLTYTASDGFSASNEGVITIIVNNPDQCIDSSLPTIQLPIHTLPLSGEQIYQFQLGSINNYSNFVLCEEGYSDYRQLSTIHERGAVIPFFVDHIFAFPFSRTDIWVDWNEDGSFQNSELVFSSTGEISFNGSIPIPNDVSLGSKVLRIRRDYHPDPYTPDAVASTTYNGGETEDYTVNVVSSLSLDEIAKLNLTVYPNPTQDYWKITAKETINTIELYDATGRKVLYLTPKSETLEINATLLAKGVYLLKINNKKVLRVQIVRK